MIKVREANPEELNRIIAWQAKRIMELDSALDMAEKRADMWWQDFKDLQKKWLKEHPIETPEKAEGTEKEV